MDGLRVEAKKYLRPDIPVSPPRPPHQKFFHQLIIDRPSPPRLQERHSHIPKYVRVFLEIRCSCDYTLHRHDLHHIDPSARDHFEVRIALHILRGLIVRLSFDNGIPADLIFHVFHAGGGGPLGLAERSSHIDDTLALAPLFPFLHALLLLLFANFSHLGHHLLKISRRGHIQNKEFFHIVEALLISRQ